MDKPKIHFYTDLSSTESSNLESHVILHNTGVAHIPGGADYPQTVPHTNTQEM